MNYHLRHINQESYIYTIADILLTEYMCLIGLRKKLKVPNSQTASQDHPQGISPCNYLVFVGRGDYTHLGEWSDSHRALNTNVSQKNKKHSQHLSHHSAQGHLQKFMKQNTYCWCLNIASLSITVPDRKFTGFKDRKFSLIHFPNGLDKATRFFTSVFS